MAKNNNLVNRQIQCFNRDHSYIPSTTKADSYTTEIIELVCTKCGMIIKKNPPENFKSSANTSR